MGNKKFSQFTEKTLESEVGKLVGISADGTKNVKVDPTKIADFTSFSIETSASGVSYIVGINAAGTQRIKITPNDLINFSGYSTETNQNNVNFLVGLNAAQNKIKIDPSKIGKSIFTGGIWNGYTYQTVTSPTTDRVWLDRNLGALNVAGTSNDSNAYGFLYQFGRKDDGHQLRNSSTGSTKLNSVYSPSDLFIINNSTWSHDFNYKVWLEDWQGIQLNSVAPPGFRLPTSSEFYDEVVGFSSNDTSGAFASFLKLPINKKRDYNSGSISTAAEAYLWCSDRVTVQITSSNITYPGVVLGTGCGVRLIKDN